MNGRKTLAGDRRRRKLITALWTLGLALVVVVLIYREMTAILYILATLGVTALLIVVALSDLGQAEKSSQVSGANEATDVAGAK